MLNLGIFSINSFTSDHGDLLGEHGRISAKGLPFRTSAGIPFIVRYPEKVLSGKIIKSALSSVDFAPSILTLMGVEDHGFESDGVDFSTSLTNDRKWINSYQKQVVFDVGQSYDWVAVIMQHLKLVVSSKDIPWLFDLKADPFEIINFFDDPNYEEAQQSLLENILISIPKYDIPIDGKKLKWSKPACWDSGDRVEVNAEYYTCADIGKSLPFSNCASSEALQQHCPVTCGVCCKDSEGKMWIKGSLYGCDELNRYCGSGMVKQFCPLKCGKC